MYRSLPLDIGSKCICCSQSDQRWVSSQIACVETANNNRSCCVYVKGFGLALWYTMESALQRNDIVY